MIHFFRVCFTMKAAAVGAQTVRRGVAVAGEETACWRGLTGLLFFRLPGWAGIRGPVVLLRTCASCRRRLDRRRLHLLRVLVVLLPEFGGRLIRAFDRIEPETQPRQLGERAKEFETLCIGWKDQALQRRHV